MPDLLSFGQGDSLVSQEFTQPGEEMPNLLGDLALVGAMMNMPGVNLEHEEDTARNTFVDSLPLRFYGREIGTSLDVISDQTPDLEEVGAFMLTKKSQEGFAVAMRTLANNAEILARQQFLDDARHAIEAQAKQSDEAQKGNNDQDELTVARKKRKKDVKKHDSTLRGSQPTRLDLAA